MKLQLPAREPGLQSWHVAHRSGAACDRLRATGRATVQNVASRRYHSSQISPPASLPTSPFITSFINIMPCTSWGTQAGLAASSDGRSLESTHRTLLTMRVGRGGGRGCRGQRPRGGRSWRRCCGDWRAFDVGDTWSRERSLRVEDGAVKRVGRVWSGARCCSMRLLPLALTVLVALTGAARPKTGRDWSKCVGMLRIIRRPALLA